MKPKSALLSAVKIIAVVDGFMLALQLLPYGGYDGVPGDTPNIHGWQAIMVVLFLISIGYLWDKQNKEIDDLKSRLLTYELKNKK